MRLLQPGSWLLTLLLLAHPCAGAAEPSPDFPSGVPDDASLARATRLIKQTFAAEYGAAATLPNRAALAQRLLKEAVDTTDDPAARYVLLCEARDLAAKAADAPTACRAIDLLADRFGVPPAEMTIAALSAASRVALTPPSQESLCAAAIAAADRAVARDEFEPAARLAAIAEAAATRTKKITLITEAQDKQKEIAWALREYAQAKIALDTLATAPDDPAARAAAGRFKCLVKNDWPHGLPLLLDGADNPLKQLAERDQAAATADPKSQFDVGDEWWAMGDTLLGRARTACRTRAAHWYALASPKLTGLPKTLADKRLAEVDQSRLREARLAPGLTAEIFDGQLFQKPFAHRVDPNVDAEWPATNRDGVPKSAFSIRWTGHLRVTTAGKHTLLLHANEGARIYLDDKLVLEEPKGANKRKPVETTVTLTAGQHPIKVEFWDTGGLAKIHLLWQPPGAKSEEPIPPRAFVHDLVNGK